MSTARRSQHNLLKAERSVPYRNFLQKDVAFWIDLDPADLGRIERGEREPSLRSALRLSSLYGKNVNEIFYEPFEEACDFVGGRQRLREVPRPPGTAALEEDEPAQSPLLPVHGRDLLLLVSPSRLMLFAVDEEARPRLLLQAPETVCCHVETLVHLLGTLLRTRRPARLLVSVQGDTHHEDRVVPLVDALHGLRTQHDLEVVWLPDLYALMRMLPAGRAPLSPAGMTAEASAAS